MPLKYQPKVKSVLMCDFSGFIEPEMVKLRPVVVLAKHKKNANLVIVIPLSTTEPIKMLAHHHKLSKNPLPDKTDECWAKCDMIYTISTHRLDRYRNKNKPGRHYEEIIICNQDFDCIKVATLEALGHKCPM